MNDILHKLYSLRSATATAIVQVSSPDTIRAIQEKTVPKGDVLEFSRAAGLLAIKKTSDVIPDCHPLPIEHAAIRHCLDDLQIHIEVNVSTIYKTGVEVEAMHGAAITALTIYDMLKPIDKGVSILGIRLKEKSGGKNDFNDTLDTPLKIAVMVCSDTVSKGNKEDKAGKAIISELERQGLAHSSYEIIPDEKDIIQNLVRQKVTEAFDLLLFTGGTGLSPRDVTPEAISPLLDREIPGIMEAARAYGQQRTPYAMLSRGVAGTIQNTLIITLPGSSKGARESMKALFPSLKHVFKVAKGMRHD